VRKKNVTEPLGCSKGSAMRKLNSYESQTKKKKVGSQTNNLMMYLKHLVKQKQVKTQTVGRKEETRS
jgi:hypothetical protein